MSSHSKERDQAEARFQKAQKAAQDAKAARGQYEADAQAMREKTARLRALRLAKEAADLAAPADKPATKKPAAAKRMRPIETAGSRSKDDSPTPA